MRRVIMEAWWRRSGSRHPVAANVPFRHACAADSASRRAVRAEPTWKAEGICGVRQGVRPARRRR